MLCKLYLGLRDVFVICMVEGIEPGFIGGTSDRSMSHGLGMSQTSPGTHTFGSTMLHV